MSNFDLHKEITDLCGESFDEGSKVTFESIISALEIIYKKQPNLSFREVIDIIKIAYQNNT